VGEEFMALARAASMGLGMPGLATARVVGHPSVQSDAALRGNILEVTLDQVIGNLLTAPDQAATLQQEPAPLDIIRTGSWEDVNEYFYDQQLADGLPIVPPTRDKIDAFLRHTDRDAEEVLGILLPDSRPATIWSVAVNGVMAGCRPEYMPVLVAIAEAMADPYYGVEHSGNTPGAETLIVLNGPIIRELEFNYTQGVMRDGFRANTSVGRFFRLYLRNVAGFLPHGNDKATFGNTWRVVVAENEEVTASLGWTPHCVDMGFEAGDNVVTIARFTGGNHISGVSGSTPQAIMPYLADAMVKQHPWQVSFSAEEMAGTLRPCVMLSPVLAGVVAAGGWSKQDFKRALHEQARVPAWHLERSQRDWRGKRNWELSKGVRVGRLPRVYHESDDPERLVPIVWDAEDYMVLVTGDTGRNSAYMFSGNGPLGYPVAKKIRLPKHWNTLRRR
jgi:hypothetical protein